MLVVGLTGGIGSGKSTAAEYFRHLNTPVYDADDIARELVYPGKPALAQIVATFGKNSLDDTGKLDRAKLRNRVFKNSSERKKLEAILHPLIRSEFHLKLKQTNSPYCILVIPLLFESKAFESGLFESGQTRLLNRILVIDTTKEQQISRIRSRDNLSILEIDAILAAQLERKMRLDKADDIILNDSTTKKLKQQVEKLHAFYLRLAENI